MLEDPIKRTGEYEVPVELAGGITATLKVVVVGE
jgi:large subunit ribosomal protein L9